LIMVAVYKKGNKTDWSNFRGISHLPTTYKILSNFLLSKLTPYTEEIVGDQECGFQCNRTTTDYIFSIHQIPGGKKKKKKKGKTMKQCIICYTLQKSLWFSWEGGLIWHSHTTEWTLNLLT
jgi:hypothetical protein